MCECKSVDTVYREIGGETIFFYGAVALLTIKYNNLILL